MLVLASGSPRRQELLRWLGIDYVVDVPQVDEQPRPAEEASALVRRLAGEKARAVAGRRAGAWVLAADTTVELAGAILGKPASAAEATAMLGCLAGCEHRVFTGFALLDPEGRLRAHDVVVTRVRFRPVSTAMIAAYVASGEPEGKAGGYAIQGRGAALVERVDGSLTNVIGLPLVEIGRALGEVGLLGR